MRRLRQLLAVSLIAGILSPTGLFHFAMDLPDVLTHYEHHNREHEAVSFLAFLLEHASNKEHHDAKHPNHNDSPFHHDHSSACCSSLLTFIPASQPFCAILPVHFETPESVTISNREQFCSSEFAAAIWQPPKA